MKLQFIFLLFGCIFCTNATYLDPEKQQQINEIVEAMMGCRAMAGTQVAVVKNGETIFSQGYGLLDLDKSDEVTPQTLFNIASITKHFVATLLAMVLEENGLSLDTKVRDVLGDDFYFINGLLTSQATMKDLAAHRLGLPRRDFTGFREGVTRENAAFDLRFVHLVGGFRDSQEYNNNLYDAMAYITEVISGENWEDLMTEKIFKLANMSSTTFIHTMDLSDEDLARPYFLDESNPGGSLIRVNDSVNARWSVLGAGGGMVSNAVDMENWMKLQLDGGRLNGVQVIPESVVRDTHTTFNTWSGDPYTKPTFPVTYTSTGYTLGFEIGTYRSYTTIFHAGFMFGYSSLLTLLPDIDIGVFVAFNGIDRGAIARHSLHAFIMDIILDEEPWIDTSTICTFPEPWLSGAQAEKFIQALSSHDDGPTHRITKTNRASPRPYPSDLSPYIGTYGDFYYGNLTVFSLDSQSLFLQYGTLQPARLVASETENVFLGIPDAYDFPLGVNSVEFSFSEEGLPQFDLCLAYFDADPSLFRRDLKRADAPEPPNPNECT